MGVVVTGGGSPNTPVSLLSCRKRSSSVAFHVVSGAGTGGSRKAAVNVRRRRDPSLEPSFPISSTSRPHTAKARDSGVAAGRDAVGSTKQPSACADPLAGSSIA
jgi:hypothetical protein